MLWAVLLAKAWRPCQFFYLRVMHAAVVLALMQKAAWLLHQLVGLVNRTYPDHKASCLEESPARF